MNYWVPLIMYTEKPLPVKLRGDAVEVNPLCHLKTQLLACNRVFARAPRMKFLSQESTLDDPGGQQRAGL